MELLSTFCSSGISQTSTFEREVYAFRFMFLSLSLASDFARKKRIGGRWEVEEESGFDPGHLAEAYL